MRGNRLFAAAALALVTATSCELREITIADAKDVVIAELVLRAGEPLQTAYLHRTSTQGISPVVPDAQIAVRDEASGDEILYAVGADSLCLDDAPLNGVQSGTCYAARVAPAAIRPGARYTLRIELPGGRVMTGTTDVPGAFDILVPKALSGVGVSAATPCRLEPGTSMEITWSRSAGASVYITEGRLRNIRQALRDAGNDVEGNEPLDLIGLSISAADTTLKIPGELGLFDRFDDDLLPILLIIRDGLPPNVDATVVVAAADRNYVNWVRGGNFNPSGLVRVGSIQGDGSGVFGALVQHRLFISTRTADRDPCS
jgi:hypothetical protein